MLTVLYEDGNPYHSEAEDPVHRYTVRITDHFPDAEGSYMRDIMFVQEGDDVRSIIFDIQAPYRRAASSLYSRSSTELIVDLHVDQTSNHVEFEADVMAADRGGVFSIPTPSASGRLQWWSEDETTVAGALFRLWICYAQPNVSLPNLLSLFASDVAGAWSFVQDSSLSCPI